MSETATTATAAPRTEQVVWAPQAGPQEALVTCPVQEILYGGARGGGKTDGVLGRIGLRAGIYGALYNAIVFRREMPQADDMLERARELYGPVSTFRAHDSSFAFRNGARLRFRPLERVQDAEKYQGQNLSDVIIEEAGNYPEAAPILRLYGALRSAGGIPSSLVMTGNPGGPGQQWLAERFEIHRFPEGFRILEDPLPDGSVVPRVFIPAKVRDNKILMANDPGYVSRLYMVGSAQLVRAWLQGDWSAVEGAFFDVWDPEEHICMPFEVPTEWLRFRSIDWGSARPASIGWWAVASDDFRHPVDKRHVSRGTLVRYREWYVAKSANVGMKLTAEEVADEIVRRSEGDDIAYTVADPSMFAADGGPSLAERFHHRGVTCRPADNRRISRLGALGGWDQMRARLVGDEDGTKILTFSICRDSIRTIPVLQHDLDRPEDLDTDGEDHAADEWRYACMSRPWTRHDTPELTPLERLIAPPTFNDLVDPLEAPPKAHRRV